MSIQELNRKSGKKFRANIYVGDGKPRIIGDTRETLKEAKYDEIILKAQILRDEYVDETQKTFDSAYSDYITLIASDNMTQDSIVAEKRVYFNHIEPVFGNKKIKSIKPKQIQRFLKEKENDGYSYSMHKIFYGILNKTFEQCVIWEELSTNPMDRVKRSKPSYKTFGIWSKEECERFLFYAKDYHSYIVFFLALQTGMRQGEILGLHWDCINFDEGTLFVKQALKRNKKPGPLKTKSSYRTIYLTPNQLDVLKKHKENQPFQTTIVCSSQLGGYMTWRNLLDTMIAICAKSGVKKIRFHDLRHTHGSLYYEATKDVKATQERLGHSEVSITMDLYVHSSNTANKKSAEKFDAFFNT